MGRLLGKVGVTRVNICIDINMEVYMCVCAEMCIYTYIYIHSVTIPVRVHIPVDKHMHRTACTHLACRACGISTSSVTSLETHSTLVSLELT